VREHEKQQQRERSLTQCTNTVPQYLSTLFTLSMRTCVSCISQRRPCTQSIPLRGANLNERSSALAGPTSARDDLVDRPDLVLEEEDIRLYVLSLQWFVSEWRVCFSLSLVFSLLCSLSCSHTHTHSLSPSLSVVVQQVGGVGCVLVFM
jgi:hypothetical protein